MKIWKGDGSNEEDVVVVDGEEGKQALLAKT